MSCKGWLEIESPIPGQRAFRKGVNRAIVSQDERGRWHLSVSRDDGLPGWGELKKARYALVPPEIWMVQVFPPQKYFVNIHPDVLHLWEVEPDDRWMQGTI